LPAEVFFRGAGPRLLKTSADGKAVEFREVYVVNVARRFQQGLGNPTAAYTEAANMLGLNSGDVSKEEAIQMVQTTLDVVKAENDKDKDGGYFNSNDQFAVGELLKAVQKADVPVANANVLDRLIKNRNLWLGAIGLLLAIPLILLGLGYLARLCAPVAISTATTTTTSTTNGARRTTRATTVVTQPAQDLIDPETAALTAPPGGPVANVFTQSSETWEEPAENEFVTGAPAAPSMDSFATEVEPPASSINLPPAKPVMATGAAALASAINQPAMPVQAVASAGNFAATYTHGDDMFDQDFAISGPKGELNGECGVSIADRLGADTPARVDALSIWVFDKADFKSVTKVIATDHAMNTPAIRAKLASKGEVVRASDNLTIEITTTRLHVVAHVTDVLLNEDDPANSYFKNARVNFTVQRRANEANVSM
jgi:hypothetical protein